MSDNPLGSILTFDRLSLRAVITRPGEDPSAALAAAGIVNPITLPIAITGSGDEAAALLGAGTTPHLAAVLEHSNATQPPAPAADEQPSATEVASPTLVAQNETCEKFISENCKASILRVFPGQFLDVPVEDVLDAAKSGDAAARKAKMLLLDSRFHK